MGSTVPSSFVTCSWAVRLLLADFRRAMRGTLLTISLGGAVLTIGLALWCLQQKINKHYFLRSTVVWLICIKNYQLIINNMFVIPCVLSELAT